MSHVQRVNMLVIILCLAFLPGCGSSNNQNVKNSVDYAKQMLERAKSGPIDRAAFDSAVGQGGNVTAYLAAGMANPEGYAPYIWNGPPAPNSVVIRLGSAPGEYVIEGYGENTDKPSSTAIVKGVGGTP
jgi:hypothetical protein